MAHLRRRPRALGTAHGDAWWAITRQQTTDFDGGRWICSVCHTGFTIDDEDEGTLPALVVACVCPVGESHALCDTCAELLENPDEAEPGDVEDLIALRGRDRDARAL